MQVSYQLHCKYTEKLVLFLTAMDTMESDIPDLELSDALSIRPYQSELILRANEDILLRYMK